MTVDHAIAGDPADFGLNNEKAMIVVRDIATRWIQCYPVTDKSAAQVAVTLRDLTGGSLTMKTTYSDNDPELVRLLTRWHGPITLASREDQRITASWRGPFGLYRKGLDVPCCKLGCLPSGGRMLPPTSV